jgi:hypothetical protein
MKMTKIESARRIVEQNGGCNNIIGCAYCCCKHDLYVSCRYTAESGDRLKFAKAYIKRHESKTKKKLKIDLSPYMKAESKKLAVKTDVRDVENVVKDVTVKESLKVDPTPLDIVRNIKAKDYVCRWSPDICKICPIRNEITQQLSCGLNRKTLIDTYIAEHDHTKDKVEKVEPCHALNGKECMSDMPCGKNDCPAYELRMNPEPVIEPILIEELRKMICSKDEYIYYFNRDEKIGRVNTKHIYEMRITGKHIVMLCGNIVEAENYYKTLADAVRVAESKWGVK